MSSLEVFAALEARRVEAPVAICSKRHVYLSDRPLIIAGYHLPAEPGAAIGLAWGMSRRGMQMVAIPHHDREMRRIRLAQFADGVASYLAGFHARRRSAGSKTVERAIDAPQLIVANDATVEWLGILARLLLGAAGKDSHNTPLEQVGSALGFFDRRRHLPGSALVVSTVDTLTRHFTFPHLAGDASLGSLLGWLEPPSGTSRRQAALDGAATLHPGPVPDPDWENNLWRPAAGRYDDARQHGLRTGPAETAMEQALTGHLQPAYQAIWQAVRLLEQISPGDTVEQRWEIDRRAWTGHLDRSSQGPQRPATRRGALRMARLLRRVEADSAELQRQMALDDPLVMARAIADGDALDGKVEAVDLTNIDHGARSRMPRPLLHIRCYEPSELPPGTELWWAKRPTVRAEVLWVNDTSVTLKVVAGVGRKLKVDPASLPAAGEHVVFSPYSNGTWHPDTLPDTTPWTHQLPETVR